MKLEIELQLSAFFVPCLTLSEVIIRTTDNMSLNFYKCVLQKKFLINVLYKKVERGPETF